MKITIDEKQYASEMLRKYLGQCQCPFLYFQRTSVNTGGLTATSSYECLLIDNTYVPTIVNVSIYVRNLTGLRANKYGAVIARSAAYLAEAIKSSLDLARVPFIQL